MRAVSGQGSQEKGMEASYKMWGRLSTDHRGRLD
ncbi:hypothetical protein IYQ_17774 [Aeromonas salmonicida subsp. salmonicida 01-B526]|uniref:Uncharacterized protein n=1 Tax=Aeromonas salmonicida subsp. salmonicida 01-B526 TaxID=1076135 RepID=A0ABN0DWY4_AERSS|nr:hypothetical protein IYQ_17774 [Aeromonas salmonicida subsp. salmonicida 01-B526]